MPRLEIALLGSPRVTLDGAPLVVDTRKAIALLAYLALSGQSHTRDALAALLWPEYEQAKARGALRRTLSVLNKALGGRWLVGERDAVALRADSAVDIDVEQFRAGLRETRAHGHPPEDVCALCVPLLGEAVTLYRGEFLEGFTLRDSANFDDWQFFQGESLRRELAGALERLVTYHSAHGEYEPAIANARRLLALDPIHEPAHRYLMQLYAWSGERAAALRQYRECERILKQELGVAPLAETTQLYDAIQQNQLPRSTEDRGRKTVDRPPSSVHLPMVGRAREWEILRTAYGELKRDGCLMVIEGEAGIGKTRLAEELIADARARGAVAITARCYEGESNLAYAPLVSALHSAANELQRTGALERLAPDVRQDVALLAPELGPGDHASPSHSLPMQARLFESITLLFMAATAGSRPGILLLDDVQWADPSSLDWLTYAVRRLRDHPLCVLVTWRSEEVTGEHRLRQLLAEAQRMELAHVLSLARLDAAAVATLVRSTALPPELSVRLYQESEGLPLFVVEYLSTLAGARAPTPARSSPAREPAAADWSLPVGVRDLLHARLAHISPMGRQLLDAAAVIGRSFDFETVCAASGRSELESVSALEELLARGIIHELADGAPGPQTRPESRLGAAPRYDFAHDKLRALVHAETSMARRRLLHRRVAEALAGSARGRDVSAIASLIAQHFQLGGEPAQAAEYFRLAGEHARQLFAHAEALHHFQSALALGHPEASDLHEAIGDLQTLRGEYSAALSSYETAAALRTTAGLAPVEHKLASVNIRRGEWDLADSHLAAALGALDPAAGGERARILADRSLVAYRRHQTDEAWALAQQSLLDAREAHDRQALAQAHNMLGVLARHRGDPGAAREHLQASLSLAERLNDLNGRMAVLNNLGLLAGASGQTADAIALTEQALALCTKYGDRHREAALHNNLADLFHAAGRQDEAMAHLKQAIAIFAEIGAESKQLQPEIWKLSEW